MSIVLTSIDVAFQIMLKHENVEGAFSAHVGCVPSILEFPDRSKEAKLLQLLSSAGLSTPKPGHCACCTNPSLETSAKQVDFYSVSPSSPPSLAEEEEATQAPAQLFSSHIKQELTAAQVPEANCTDPADSNCADRKPIISADGKVACLQCSARVAKRHFNDHVANNHLSAGRFICNECSYVAKKKDRMLVHIKSHGAARDNMDAYTEVDLKDEIRQVVEACFGSADEVKEEEKMCRSCKVPVRATNVRNHILSKHLKKALHSCRLCDYTSMQVYTWNSLHRIAF